MHTHHGRISYWAWHFTHKTQPATVRLWEILYMFVGGLNISTGDWAFWLGWTTNYGGLHTSHNTTRAGLMLNNNIWYINIMVIISEYFGNIWTGWTKTYGGLHTSHNTTYVHTYACTHICVCPSLSHSHFHITPPGPTAFGIKLRIQYRALSQSLPNTHCTTPHTTHTTLHHSTHRAPHTTAHTTARQWLRWTYQTNCSYESIRHTLPVPFKP